MRCVSTPCPEGSRWSGPLFAQSTSVSEEALALVQQPADSRGWRRRTAVLIVGEEERQATDTRVVARRDRDRVPTAVGVAGPAVLVQVRRWSPNGAVALNAPRTRRALGASRHCHTHAPRAFMSELQVHAARLWRVGLGDATYVGWSRSACHQASW